MWEELPAAEKAEFRQSAITQTASRYHNDKSSCFTDESAGGRANENRWEEKLISSIMSFPSS